MGKLVSLITTTLAFIAGIVLIFIPEIDMERYRTFCLAFAPLAITLMTSIGVNAGIEKLQEKKNEKDI